MDNDSQLNDRFYQKKEVEPLIQSVHRRSQPRHYSKYLTKDKVYEYKIDPMLEYSPGQLETFRDRRYTQYANYFNALRYQDPETPKSLLKKSANSLVSNLSINSKKTVRFAESAEGLLKSVAVDPTFNDSDFVYDMHYRIE